MRRAGFPNIIKIILSLMLVHVIILINNIKFPAFFLLGLIQIEGIDAELILLVLLFSAVLLMYGNVKRYARAHILTKWFYSILAINYLLTIIASFFFSEDFSGFLGRIYGTNVYSGYIALTVLGFLLCFTIAVVVEHHRLEYVN